MFARMLAAARPETLTQEEAAARVGVSRSTLSLWERGAVMPPADGLARLLKVYRVGAKTRLAIYDAASG